MLFKSLPSLLLLASFTAASMVKRQAPNTIYPGNESQMTASNNMTAFLLPISKEVLGKLGGSKYSYLKPEGFPEGFIGEDEHLLHVVFGYQYDIRMLGLRVDQLTGVNFYVPFLDVLEDGKTAFSQQVYGYTSQLIPALVADLEFNSLHPAIFDPPHAAYKAVGEKDFSITVSQGIDNPIDGPGLLIPRAQTTFRKTSKANIPASTFKAVGAQPVVRKGVKLCSVTQNFYNETFANPSHVEGLVQLYHPVLPKTQSFKNAYGYTATTEWIAPAGFGSNCRDFQK